MADAPRYIGGRSARLLEQLEESRARNVVLGDRLAAETAQGEARLHAITALEVKLDNLERLRAQAVESAQRSAVKLAEVEVFLAAVLGLDNLDGWVSRPPLPAPPQLDEPLQAIVREYWRAKQKHGENCIDGPGYSHFERLTIVMEELGEVAHELTYDARSSDADDAEGVLRLWNELVQTGAMVAGWLAFLWQQYGAALQEPGGGGEAPETAAEPTEGVGWQAGAGLVPGLAGKLPAVPSAFADAVHELTGAPTRARPQRGPDVVGRDMEGRFWSLWHDEGVKVYLPSPEMVGRDLDAAAYPSLVNLTRSDLAQYADAADE